MATVWPAHASIDFRTLDAVFFFSVTALITVFVTKRTPLSLGGWKFLSLGRWLVLAVLIDSLLFVYMSGILVLGIGTSASETSCASGIWWCIVLYASSKVLIYLFLMERVHLVYSSQDGGEQSRLKSKFYRLSVLFLFLWLGVAIAMVVGRISYRRRHDQACVIGIKLFSSVPMLVVDAIVNVYLTAAFVIPIWRSKFSSAQGLALKSSIAAVASLVTSAANVAIITSLHGKQLSWVCLTSCGIDVTLNACILFWITSADSNDPVIRQQSVVHFSSSFAAGSTHRPSMSYNPTLRTPGTLAFPFPSHPRTHQVVLRSPSMSSVEEMRELEDAGDRSHAKEVEFGEPGWLV